MDPDLRKPCPYGRERPVGAVVDRLPVREAEDPRDGRGRQLIHDVQLQDHAVLWGERAERVLEQAARVPRVFGWYGLIDDFGRHGRPQLSEHMAPPSVGDGEVGGPQLGEKRPEGERGGLAGADQPIGFDVTALAEADVLEDAAPQAWQRRGDGGEPAAAVAVPKPVDREMADDRDEPRGKTSAVVLLCREGTEPSQIVFAQGLAHPREDVHHIVMVLGVVADGREDEASLAAGKQGPPGVGFSRLPPGSPALPPAELHRGLAGYTSRRRPVKR